MTQQPDYRMHLLTQDLAAGTIAALRQNNADLHAVLMRMTNRLAVANAEIAHYRLMADQQHANEPDDVFADADPAPATTLPVMPARALRADKQAVGLFW